MIIKITTTKDTKVLQYLTVLSSMFNLKEQHIELIAAMYAEAQRLSSQDPSVLYDWIMSSTIRKRLQKKLDLSPTAYNTALSRLKTLRPYKNMLFLDTVNGTVNFNFIPNPFPSSITIIFDENNESNTNKEATTGTVNPAVSRVETKKSSDTTEYSKVHVHASNTESETARTQPASIAETQTSPPRNSFQNNPQTVEVDDDEISSTNTYFTGGKPYDSDEY